MSRGFGILVMLAVIADRLPQLIQRIKDDSGSMVAVPAAATSQLAARERIRTVHRALHYWKGAPEEKGVTRDQTPIVAG